MVALARGGMRTMIGRGMARSLGQVAISVIATLIATQIYHALRTVEPAATTASVTPGGKYDTRIAGAELPPLPEPARPALSIVHWSLGPVAPTRRIEDVAWSGAEDDQPVPAGPAPRPARRDAHRMAVASTTLAPLPPAPPARAAVETRAAPVAVASAAPAMPAEQAGGLWSMATGTVHTVLSAGVSAGGSVLAFGGSTLGHILPDRR